MSDAEVKEDQDDERYDRFEVRVLELVKELESEDESTTCSVFMRVMGMLMAKAMYARDPEDRKSIDQHFDSDPMLLLQDMLSCVGEEALHEYKEDPEHYFTFNRLSFDVQRHKKGQLAKVEPACVSEPTGKSTNLEH